LGFTLPKALPPQPGLGENAADATPVATFFHVALGGAGFNLLRTAVRPAGILPHSPTTLKRPATEHKQPQKSSNDTAQTAPVAVVPALPELEIAAAIADATGESHNLDSDIAVKPAASHAEHIEPAESSAPNVTAGESQAQSKEMAFAARVQPVQRAEHSALPAEMASAAAVASASKKVVPAADDQTASPADAHGLLATAAHSVERNAEPAVPAAPAPHAAPAAHRAEAPTAPAETPGKTTPPLKDISLQVNQPGKERVDVRVVQQGGEVRVSVHSGDASLTTGLRQGLSELQSRLEETGYRSELWKPGAAAAPVAAAPSAQESNNHSRGDEPSQQQGGSQQESGRRHQNQSNQPRWVEELESSFDGGQKSSGGSHGFSS